MMRDVYIEYQSKFDNQTLEYHQIFEEKNKLINTNQQSFVKLNENLQNNEIQNLKNRQTLRTNLDEISQSNSSL